LLYEVLHLHLPLIGDFAHGRLGESGGEGLLKRRPLECSRSGGV